jgi:hypothetical protein
MIPQVGLSVEFDPFGSYVYKLWYGEKYLIVKCKTLRRSLNNINNDLDYYFKGTKRGRTEDNDNYWFYKFVFENPSLDFTIEPILKNRTPYELLKCEFLELEKGKEDPRCLNKPDAIPYIPASTQRPNHTQSWINRGYYLNFMAWRKRYLSQKTA